MKNKVKILYLRILECVFKLFRKDPMKIQLDRYRLYGVNIGDNVRAFSPITSAEPYLISVGDNVTVSTGVRFITHDNSVIKIYDDATDVVGSIKIGSNCFIGANAIILPGVEIADDCVIGAGSVVCKSCNTCGAVLAGNPAKVIGSTELMRNKYFPYRFNFAGGG